MLNESPIDLILDVPDLAAARAFWVDTVGLVVVREDQRGAMDLAAGGDSRLSLRETGEEPDREQTRGSFRVHDLTSEMSRLVERGVVFKDYDLPGLFTTDGIADLGFGWGAWFVDPGLNVIGLIELK